MTNSICVHVLEAPRGWTPCIFHTTLYAQVPIMGLGTPKVQRGVVMFRLAASGASGFGCSVHAAHSSAAFTLDLSLRLLPLLTPQMNPRNQDPDSISCPQPLGLNSKHLSLLFITQDPCEDTIPFVIVHGIRSPHMLWRDPGAFQIRGSGPAAGAQGT